MILTSVRVICINEKNSAFKAFDLPLSLISSESFEQPIFGANYLYGICKPLLNSLPGNIEFKIWLMNGGCGTLAPAYLKMIKSCKRNRGRGAEQNVINSYQGGKKAYIDPNDPSVIYLQQPEVAQNINYNPFGYQPVPQGPQQHIPPKQVNQFSDQPAPMPNIPNNNYPNYPSQSNQINNQPPMNNNMPPNYGNNINNNYPNFNHQNQHEENELPSQEEVYANSENNNNNNSNNNNQQYPSHGMEGLNEVINNQPQQGGKYFGFWGPSLERNPNQPNNNGQ
jgi:hypothetical protein